MMIEIYVDGKKRIVPGHHCAMTSGDLSRPAIQMLDMPDVVENNWMEVTSLADTCRRYITLIQ